MPRSLQVAWIAVLAAGIASASLFRWQGGVGGGHGRFDQVIGILGMPWVLSNVFRTSSDLASFVILPFLVNVAILWVITLVLLWKKRHRTRGA